MLDKHTSVLSRKHTTHAKEHTHTHAHTRTHTHSHAPVPSEAYIIFSNLLSSVKTEIGFGANVGFFVTTNVWHHV